MDNPSSDKEIFNRSTEQTKPPLTITTPLKNENHNIQYGGTADDDVPLLNAKLNERKCSKCLRFLASLTIEPATFLFMFAYVLSRSCLSNLMMDKGCLYYFNYTTEICNNMSAYPAEKEKVEILANNYGLYVNIMSLIAAAVMIFIAPWSDKHGRKVPLVLACIGGILGDIGLIMCVYYFDSSLNYFILIKIPSEIFGGIICFLTIVFSHAAEVTTEKNRTLKYTTIELAFAMAISFGGLAGGMILRYYGYMYVYLTGIVLHFLSMLWVIFMVEETAGVGVNTSWKVKQRDFFRLDSVTKSWKATVRPRENNERLKIWLYLLSMCLVILTYETSGSLGYIYTHNIYNWDPASYNEVNTEISVAQYALMVILTPMLLKKFNISDSLLGILGTISMMVKNGLIAFAKYSVPLYYLGYAAGFLSGFVSLSIRSAVSKITNKEETSLVFSFLATCEAVFPMLCTTFGTTVYNATIDIFPSVLYLLVVGLLTIPLGTFMWTYKYVGRPKMLIINSNA